MKRRVRVYRHRVNTLADLETVPGDMGIEFDLRSSGNDVLVTHDPFTTGPTIATSGKMPEAPSSITRMRATAWSSWPGFIRR